MKKSAIFAAIALGWIGAQPAHAGPVVPGQFDLNNAANAGRPPDRDIGKQRPREPRRDIKPLPTREVPNRDRDFEPRRFKDSRGTVR